MTVHLGRNGTTEGASAFPLCSLDFDVGYIARFVAESFIRGHWGGILYNPNQVGFISIDQRPIHEALHKTPTTAIVGEVSDNEQSIGRNMLVKNSNQNL